MRICSFNVNGIRARQHQIDQLIDTRRPQIIGVQETKVADELFPHSDMHPDLYECAWHGQKGHYGVATLTSLPIVETRRGFPWDDDQAQRRMIETRCDLGNGRELRIINAYFPQGENRDHPVKFPAKRTFYADLLRYLREHADPSELVCVLGDMNIAPRDADVGIGEQNARRWLRTGKCCFLPEERQWLQDLCDWGLHDSYALLDAPDGGQLSWFDYRSRGFDDDPRRGLRIDLILISQGMLPMLRGGGIDYDIRAMQRPSDHCPVWADFHVE